MKKSILVLSLVGAMACSSVSAFASEAQQKEVATFTTISASKLTETADVEETKSLFFNFDDAKYDLVQEEGSNLVSLMSQADELGRRSNVFLSWKYISNNNAETAGAVNSEEINSLDGFIGEVEITDLEINSVKITNEYKEDNSTTTKYFIEDGAGGVYEVFVNNMAFDFTSAQDDLKEIKKSMQIQEKKENKNFEKIQKVAPFLD